PQDMDYVVSLDTTRAVTEGMKEIILTLLIAIALVIVVVYIFLQGWRATLIPLLAVPVSLVGTFVFFPLFGFSINTLSLFGLVLAIGLVVDDAIVVVEAVERHIEEGLAPKEAAFKAMEEISGAVIRQGAVARIALAAVAVAAGFFGNRVPKSFLPDEDQGYMFINLQLPNAASLERTSAAARDIERVLAGTPGVQYTTSVVGFSL